MIITQETAHQFFGSENPIGKIITPGGGYVRGNYTVTGVISVPENSTLQFDMVSSL